MTVPTRLDQWRRENPDALRTWTTKHGCVVLFWGVKVYYGTCVGCGGLVHTRRYVSTDQGKQPLGGGAWPSLCERCRERRQSERRDKSRKLMAKRRKREYADRAVEYDRMGWTPPRQGVPAKDRRTGASIMLTEPEDDFDDWYDDL